MIEVKNLSKYFGKKQILSNINFSLNAGEVLGILGPNGAGKTTLLRIICGLVKPNKGEVVFDAVSGHQIATIFEDQRFLGHLSGIKNLNLFLRSIYDKQFSLPEKFQQFGLAGSEKVKFKVYSSGMKKRLDLMSVFLGSKRLYLLDEPTNFLDIESMVAFNQQVISLKNEGKSFIIASHHSMELEKICDSFVLIDKGNLVAQASREQILNEFDTLENAYLSLIPRNKEAIIFQP